MHQMKASTIMQTFHGGQMDFGLTLCGLFIETKDESLRKIAEECEEN